jgi:hypothetical protein
VPHVISSENKLNFIHGVLDVSKECVKVWGGYGRGFVTTVVSRPQCSHKQTTAARQQWFQPPPVTTLFVRICAFVLQKLICTKLGRDSMFCRVEEGELGWLNVSNTINHEVNLNVWKLSYHLTENTSFLEFWSSRSRVIEDACVLGFKACSVGQCFMTFRGNFSPSSSRLQGPWTNKDEFIRRVWDHTPSDTTSRPRRLVS